MSPQSEGPLELEAAFTFCAMCTVRFHPSLKQQMIDGLNGAKPSTAKPGLLEFNVAMDPQAGFILPSGEWHQDPTTNTCVGSVTLDVGSGAQPLPRP